MLELNKVYCENNVYGMKKLSDNFLDIIITSPPYDDLRDYSGNGWNFDNFKLLANEMYLKTKDGGVVAWVVGDATIKGGETGSSFKQLLYFLEIGFKLYDVIIYEKNGSSFPSRIDGNRYSQTYEYVFILSKNKMPNIINLIKEKNKRYDTEYLEINNPKLINKYNININDKVLIDNIKTWNNYENEKQNIFCDIYNLNLGKDYINNIDTKEKLDLSFLFVNNKLTFEENMLNYKNIIDKTINGGVIVLFGKNEIFEDNSMSSLSFSIRLDFLENNFIIHDTMLLKDELLEKRTNGYVNETVYMFILSKKTKPKQVNLLCDKRNKWVGSSSFGNSSMREKDGVLKKRKIKTIKNFSPRNNIWRYNNNINEEIITNVWKYNTGKNYSTKDLVAFEHPAIYPEKLVDDLLKTFTKNGCICCDPFSGSGTTFKICLLNNIKFIGFEISEKYIDITNKRIINYL